MWEAASHGPKQKKRQKASGDRDYSPRQFTFPWEYSPAPGFPRVAFPALPFLTGFLTSSSSSSEEEADVDASESSVSLSLSDVEAECGSISSETCAPPDKQTPTPTPPHHRQSRCGESGGVTTPGGSEGANTTRNTTFWLACHTFKARSANVE